MSTAEQVTTNSENSAHQCKCDRDAWINFMVFLGLISSAFIILTAILNLLTVESAPEAILSVYLVILALPVILAELRVFKPLRAMIFHVIKYVYFLTSYNGRALFYFFMGSVMFKEDSALNIVACVIACTTGVLLFALNCYFKFPMYIDPQVAKMQAEARLKWERDEAQRRLISATQTPNAAAGALAATGGAVAGAAAAQQTQQAQYAAQQAQYAAQQAQYGAQQAQYGAQTATHDANAAAQYYGQQAGQGADQAYQYGAQYSQQVGGAAQQQAAQSSQEAADLAKYYGSQYPATGSGGPGANPQQQYQYPAGESAFGSEQRGSSDSYQPPKI